MRPSPTDFALTDAEAEARLAQALSRDYWRGFVDLSIEDQAQHVPPTKLQEQVVAREVQRVAEDGYFTLPPLVDDATTARLCGAHAALYRAGWPVAFSFVFDDAWTVYRHPALIDLLTRALGGPYRAMSRVWAHHLAPRPGTSGWRPHFDGRRLEGRITAWVSLDGATSDNGCIYLVPKRRVGPELNGAIFEQPLANDDLRRLLQSVKAVPTMPGQIIGWSFDLLHWGSMSEGGAPRTSQALEFIAEGAEPLAQEQPTFDIAVRLPTFEERLVAIGAAILSYQSFDLWAERFVALGRLLVERLR